MSILEDIYSKYLTSDDMWHFFWEGNDTFIRVTQRADNDMVKRYLMDNMIRFEISRNTWEDPVKVTREYQEAFAHIFHGFSVIAMKLFRKEKQTRFDDIVLISERMLHCFSNNVAQLDLTYEQALQNIIKWGGSKMSEPMILLINLFMNMMFSGWRYLR
jgi:hypothetical protein